MRKRRVRNSQTVKCTDDSDRYGAQSCLHCHFICMPALRETGRRPLTSPRKKEHPSENERRTDELSVQKGEESALSRLR